MQTKILSLLVVAVVVFGGGGCALDERLPPAPTAPTIELAEPFDPTGTIAIQLPAPVDVTTARQCLALVEGEPPAGLVDALGKTLSKSDQSALVAVDIESSGSTVTITPTAPLAVETGYALILGACLPVGSQALGRPLVKSFQTGTLAEGAPVLSLVAPVANAPSVVRNLAAVQFMISRPVSPLDLALVSDDGTSVPAHLDDRSSCEGCGQLDLDAVLVPGHYRLQLAATAVASDGRGAFGPPPGFTVGGELRSLPIALGGVRLEGVDRCVVASFSTTEPANTQLCLSSGCAAASGSGSQRLAVTAVDGVVTASLSAGDESTRPLTTVSQTVTLSDVALVMTEVLPEPLGSHYAQELVELHSRSASPLSLGGLALVTSEGRNALPAVTVPPNGYALVVAHSFVANDGQDAVPAPTAVLAPVAEGRLGGYGLRVGEPVWIEDGAGRVVTRWSGFAVELAHGQSVVRTSDDACDLAASFVANPTGSATPGW